MIHSGPEWSNITLVLYIISGVVCWANVYYVKKNKKILSKGFFCKEYFVWYIWWIALAVFRKVDIDHGGKDAPSYIEYFQSCLHNSADTTDFAFKVFNQGIRLLTSNYKVFFFIYYSIIIFSLVIFINEFLRTQASTIPLMILIYLYLRSFTSMRSNFAIAIILLSLVALHRKKYFFTIIFAGIAVLTHVSAFIYVAFIVFYFFYHDRKIGIVKSIVFFAFAFLVGTYIQRYVLSGGFAFLTDIGSGAYASYARRSLSRNFILDYSVSNIPQLVLFLTLMFFSKPLNELINESSEVDKTKLEFLRLMAYYDFCMIPVLFLFDIYRGYEFFYVARLVLWGELIVIIRKYFNTKSKKIVNLFFLIIFIIWMINRIGATWESSHLMPYIFDLI